MLVQVVADGVQQREARFLLGRHGDNERRQQTLEELTMTRRHQRQRRLVSLGEWAEPLNWPSECSMAS